MEAPSPTAPDEASFDEADLLGALRTFTDEKARHDAASSAAEAKRVELYRRLRARGVTLTRIAEAARVSDAAVSQAIRRSEEGKNAGA